MALQPIPLHLKIASVAVFLLMTAYLLAILWYISDIQRGPTWVVGGIFKGLLIPIPMLLAEYIAVFRRDIKTSLIVAIGWFAIAITIGWQLAAAILASDPMPKGVALLFGPIPLVATTLVPVYVGLSHLLWWRALRAEKSRVPIPPDITNVG